MNDLLQPLKRECPYNRCIIKSADGLTTYHHRSRRWPQNTCIIAAAEKGIAFRIGRRVTQVFMQRIFSS